MFVCLLSRIGERWTAKQLLQHPWITLNGDHLATKDLSASVEQMKKFNAKRRMKAAVQAVKMSNMMKKLTQIKPEDTATSNHDDDKDLHPHEALTITPELEKEAKEAMKIKGLYFVIKLICICRNYLH